MKKFTPNKMDEDELWFDKNIDTHVHKYSLNLTVKSNKATYSPVFFSLDLVTLLC